MLGRRVLNRRTRRSSMNNREISHLQAAGSAAPLFGHLFGHEFLRFFRPFAEEELLHLLDQEGTGLRFYRG